MKMVRACHLPIVNGPEFAHHGHVQKLTYGFPRACWIILLDGCERRKVEQECAPPHHFLVIILARWQERQVIAASWARDRSRHYSFGQARDKFPIRAKKLI